MPDIDSVDAARDHVVKIRHQQGLNDDLESALNILSEELYHKSTHFLLELIQNADDNTYEVLEPTLTLTFDSGYLRVDCNEKGFSAQNIEAICKIGRSTKSAVGDTTRYVGEKGIGFKSVFKVADVVWISSGHYSFKFDKNTPLGMIAPLWESFPGRTIPGVTSMMLRLSLSYDKRQLIEELKALNPRILIFLRQLKRINVVIQENDGSTERSVLIRADACDAGESIVQLRHNDDVLHYIVTRHNVTNLPSETKRLGVSESEILMAFPFRDGRPKIGSQEVYAFLPIRSYGFNFLLQADFLLIASREDIDSSSLWNSALRAGFVNAIAATAKQFNSGPLRYTWPRYLPIPPHPEGFFKQLKEDTLRRLANEQILESHSGQMANPLSLMYVPEKFVDSCGVPLVLSPQNGLQYLSQNYAHSDWKHLEPLGVREVSEGALLKDLEALLANHRHDFQLRSPEWHSRLAKVLIPLVTQVEYKARISALQLIPLRDGQWISGDHSRAFFPAGIDGVTIPEGIDVLVVDPEAAADLERHCLLRYLGVTPLSNHQVCQLIVKTHQGPNFDPLSLIRREVISQAIFLWASDWRKYNGGNIWFVTEKDERVKGQELYLTSEEPQSASKFLVNHRDKFHFIHPEYISSVSSGAESWIAWLRDQLRASILPRLVRYTSEQSFDLAQDFELITREFSSSDYLLLLRDNWQYYSNWLNVDAKKDDESEFNQSVKRVRKKLGSVRVKCLGGEFHRFDQTFLSIPNMMAEATNYVPFVEVEDPENSRWGFLKFFGVGLEGNVRFYLRCLESLAGTVAEHEKVSSYLEQIQARYTDDAEFVRDQFQEKNLIYIPRSNDRESCWIPLKKCLWQGPKCLQTFIPIKDIYPTNRKLFCDILKVHDAQMEDLVSEAQQFDRYHRHHGLQHITDVLFEIDKFLEKDSSNLLLRKLQRSKIIPIRSEEIKSQHYQLKCPRVNSSDWFIADRHHLEAVFNGKIPLIALSVDDVQRMQRLPKALGIEWRKLSSAAKAIPNMQGLVTPDQEYMEWLQRRVDLIIRLIPQSYSDRKKISKQLRNVEVNTAASVMQEWSLQCNGCEIKSAASTGHVVLTPEDGILRIYLADGYKAYRNPHELVEKLCEFCGINNKYHMTIILTEEDQARIEDILSQDGVPSLKFDEDDMGDNESYRRCLKPSVDSWGKDDDATTLNSQYLSPRTDLNTGNLSLDIRRAQVVAFAEKFSIKEAHVFSLNRIPSFKAGGMPLTPYGMRYSSRRGAQYGKPEFADGGHQSGITAGGGTGSVRSSILNMLRILGVRSRNPTKGPSDIGNEMDANGQLFFHKLLEKYLKEDYLPNEHWTSKLRTIAGYEPFDDRGESKATFTLRNHSGKFTDILAEMGYGDARDWTIRSPTYHLEVITTKAGLDSEFGTKTTQFENARKFTIKSPSPSDVYILVRVINSDAGTGKPGMALLVDPWQMYLADQLSFTANNGYRVQVVGALD